MGSDRFYPGGGARPDGRRCPTSGGRAPGHQRGVPAVRQGHRARHGRRTAAGPGGLPRRRPRRPRARFAGLPPHRRARAAGRLDPLVALGPRAPTGGTPRARARPCTAANCTPSCTSATRTPSPTPPGPAAGCPPRPSGSTPPAAGSTRPTYAWGDDPEPRGRIMANRWFGRFPWENLSPHGFDRHVAGQAVPGQRLRALRRHRQRLGVDRHRWPRPRTAPTPRRGRARLLRAARRRRSTEHARRVIKGGSHLCAPSYCLRYRPAARQGQEVRSSTGHLGFRCVRDVPPAAVLPR